MRLSLLPVLCTPDGPLPARIELIALISTHLRLKGAVNGPVLCDFLFTAPETCRQASKICSTQSRGLSNLWSLHGYAEDVCLELHQQVIADCPTIDTQRLQGDTAISSHCLHYFAGLIAHGLKCGTSNMGNG